MGKPKKIIVRYIESNATPTVTKDDTRKKRDAKKEATDSEECVFC